MKHDHTCRCGAFFQPHPTGYEGCYREFAPQPEPMCNDRWRVEGVEISGYSLREQRLYHRHPCGCWSRAKHGSTNSIDA